MIGAIIMLYFSLYLDPVAATHQGLKPQPLQDTPSLRVRQSDAEMVTPPFILEQWCSDCIRLKWQTRSIDVVNATA